MPAVILNGPNMICFVANKFAEIRQTQKSIPSHMKDTLTIFPFIFLFFKRLPSTRCVRPESRAAAKIVKDEHRDK